MKFTKRAALTILFLFSGLFFSAAQELTADANTLLLLHFNGNLTGEQGETPLTAINITYQPGIFGQGAYLGINNLLEYSSAANIDEQTGTIECWIKPTWNANDSQDHRLLKYGNSGGMLFGKDAGNWWTNIFNLYGGSGDPEMSANAYAGNFWAAGEWHHIAVSWEMTDLKFYLDGELLAHTSPAYPLPAISETIFQIGGHGNTHFAEAVVDELRISNVVRSASEITASYTSGLTITGLSIEPSSTNLYPTWRKKPVVNVTSLQGANTIPSETLSWASSNPLVASVNNEGYIIAHSAGFTTITGSISGFSDDVMVTVTAPFAPPVYESIDPFLSTPASGALVEIPVVILRYLPTVDGVMLDASKAPDYWDLNPIPLTDLKATIDAFDKRVKFGLEEGSKFRGYNNPTAIPYIGYKVVEYITIYETTPPWEIGNYDGNGFPLYHIDHHSIFERFNLEHYINDLGVREVWIWDNGGMTSDWPSYDPMIHDPEDFRTGWESNMSSPVTGDISNSNRDNSDLPVYNHTYIVYGQNFRRSQAEAVHNRGHQFESMLSHVNQLQDGNTDLFWKKFVGQNASGQFITGRCGWTHMPPNTTADYDYLNPAVVNSDIEDWQPDGGGQTTPVSVSTWENLTYAWPGAATFSQKTESQWYLYWMQSIPGLNNEIPYGSYRITNWWAFIADWDQSINDGLGLYGLLLPIDLLSFEAKKSDHSVMLTWETAAESNNKGFEIQRSGDGFHWEISGFVNGQNTSVQEHYYAFLDKNPDNGLNYYRLRQVDNNENAQYSVIRTVEFQMSASPAKIEIFPNPATSNKLTVVVQIPDATIYQISIFDVSGKQWLSQTCVSEKIALVIKDLLPGVYFLKVEMEDRLFLEKIIVNK